MRSSARSPARPSSDELLRAAALGRTALYETCGTFIVVLDGGARGIIRALAGQGVIGRAPFTAQQTPDQQLVSTMMRECRYIG